MKQKQTTLHLSLNNSITKPSIQHQNYFRKRAKGGVCFLRQFPAYLWGNLTKIKRPLLFVTDVIFLKMYIQYITEYNNHIKLK